MAHPPHQPPDIYEHEYAIRRLTEAVQTLTDQAEVNAGHSQKNREDILEIKARVAIFASLIGAVAATAVSLLMKFIK